MQLLAACQKAPSVRRVVLKSTTAVYGASPRDPALFDETMTPNDLPRRGYAKDAVEIEGYVRGFARRRPDVAITVLRFASFIGPRIDTVAHPLLRAAGGAHRARLRRAAAAAARGGRARRARARRGRDDLPGVVNVAADGVLLLSQAIRRAGRVPLPVPTPAVGAVGPRCSRGARLASTSPPSSCGCSTSAGSSTPPGCAASSASPRAGPPRRPSTTSCAAARCARSSGASRWGGRTARRPRRARCRTAARRARKPAVTGDDGRPPPSPTAPGSSRCTLRSRRARRRRPVHAAPARVPSRAGRLADRRNQPVRAVPQPAPEASPTGSAVESAERDSRSAPARLGSRARRRAGLPAPPADRRLRGRRLRLRRRPHRQRHPPAAAAAVRDVVPGRDHRPGARAGRAAARWSSPTTPAPCRSTR